jgi:hypothetical protein
MGFVANLFKTYPRGSNPTLSGPGLPRVVTSALLLLAGFLLWRELEPNLMFRPTDGVVLGCGVSKVTTYVSRARTDYVPEVAFRYQVNGLSYLGTQYQRTALLSRGRAETLASRLGRGPGYDELLISVIMCSSTLCSEGWRTCGEPVSVLQPCFT